MAVIRQRFKELKARQETALIAFMMAGMPGDRKAMDSILALEEAGCDLLELGFPYSDPLADGDSIERLHHLGVEMGITPSYCLDFAHRIKSRTRLPLVVFSYFNLVFQRGIARFMQELQDIGIDGLIIPDLPLHEMERFQDFAVEVIPMVAPSTSEARLDLLTEKNPGFVYCVSVKGITGKRELPREEIKEYLQKVRRHTDSPLALGFGISSPEQIRLFREEADAVVIGSHFAEIIRDNAADPAGAIGAEARKLKAACRPGPQI